MAGNSHGFSSPTESDFSDSDGPDSVKNWDEDRVCDYLASVKCGEYEKLFRKNHINGENLLEMDKEVLKEMGIDKVGDRVRLFLSIKKLRTKAYANQKKRNRVSFPLCTQSLGRGKGIITDSSLPTFRIHLLDWISSLCRALAALLWPPTHDPPLLRLSTSATRGRSTCLARAPPTTEDLLQDLLLHSQYQMCEHDSNSRSNRSNMPPVEAM